MDKVRVEAKIVWSDPFPNGVTAMSNQNWEVNGDYIESCNCDYLCPCIYTNPQGPATHDNCIALMAFRVSKGRFGDVSLDGMKFAFIIRSGRVMADGNWVFASVIDEMADDDQRGALGKIVGGEAVVCQVLSMPGWSVTIGACSSSQLNSFRMAFEARSISPTFFLMKSRVCSRGNSRASRFLLTIPDTLRIAAWLWHVQAIRGCMDLALISI